MAQAMINNSDKARNLVRVCVLTSAIRRFDIKYPPNTLDKTEAYLEYFAKDMYFAMGKLYLNMRVKDEFFQTLAERFTSIREFETYCVCLTCYAFDSGYNTSSFLLYLSWISFLAFKIKELKDMNVIESAITIGGNVWVMYMDTGDFEKQGGWPKFNEIAENYHSTVTYLADEETSDDKGLKHGYFQESIDKCKQDDELKDVDKEDICHEQGGNKQDICDEKRNVDKQDLRDEQQDIDKQDVCDVQKDADKQEICDEQKDDDKQDICDAFKDFDKLVIHKKNR